jgi:hypothetical protein
MKKRRPTLVFGGESTKMIKASATTISRALRIRRSSRGSTAIGDANLTANLSEGSQLLVSRVTGQWALACVSREFAEFRFSLRACVLLCTTILYERHRQPY